MVLACLEGVFLLRGIEREGGGGRKRERGSGGGGGGGERNSELYYIDRT